jgi:hypothetical protein
VLDGGGQGRQVLGAGARGERRAGFQARAKLGGAATQTPRQVLVDLAVRAGGGVVHASFGGAAGGGEGGQPEEGRDRLVVVEHERWQCGARGEPIVPAGAGSGLDGVTVAAEAVDVAAQRPGADVEPRGQLVAAERPTRLQRGQQGEDALGDIRHGTSLADIAVRFRPHLFVGSSACHSERSASGAPGPTT